MRIVPLLFAAILSLACARGALVDFEAAGATPGRKSSTKVAFTNTAILNRTLASLNIGDTLVIPNKTFVVMGGVYSSGLTSVAIQIDGTLQFKDDLDAWPKNGKMPVTAITVENSFNLTITSSGTGTLDGKGGKWWGIPGIGYLIRGKDRPPLMAVNNATDFVLEHILLLNSPRFHFISSGLNNAVIRYSQVSARRTNWDCKS